MSLTKLSHACKVLPKITVRMKLRQSIWVQLGLLSALVTATGAASKPTECCIPSLVYTKRYWSKQSCVAGDLLELPHSAPSLVQPYSTIRTLSSDSSTDDGEDDPECHHWFDIDTDELVTMVKRSEEEEGYMLLIDVREPEELDQTGEIPGSINIPLGEVEEAFTMTPLEFELSYGVELPASDDHNIVFSCRSGIRSRLAMEMVHHLGFENARHYMRGWLGWEEHLEQVNDSGLDREV